MPTKTGMTLSPLTILPPERGKTPPQTKKTLQRAISFLIPFHQTPKQPRLWCSFSSLSNLKRNN
jgi:hypothetical protein